MEAEKYIISENATTLEALGRLNALSGGAMVLFAVDDAGRVTGTLTDGDVRRSLISGSQLDTPISEIMNCEFASFRGARPDVAEIRKFRSRRITLIPHINADGTLRRVYDFSEYDSILPVDAVLMAGGTGERLRPMTLTTPKPLLKVGGKCIIDYNIDILLSNGVTNISVTVNYLADQIEAHFAQPIRGVQVKCLREPRKLGTIGAMSLVDDLESETVLLMNSDLLTNINLEDMYMTHIEANADMTIAVIPYTVSVPYAIFRTEGNRVMSLQEKPTYNYFANAGIYMIKRDYVDVLSRGERMDADEFMGLLISQGHNVRQFPINGTWIDIGSPADYKAAQDLMSRDPLWK